MPGWGGFLDQLISKLPILTPAQRRRQNIDKLEKQIKDLEDKPWTPELAARVLILQSKLNGLHSECKNLQ